MNVNVDVMGITIGTAEEWDDVSFNIVQLYQFKPSISGLQASDVAVVNYESGEITLITLDDNDEQQSETTIKLLPLLVN